MSSEQPEAGPPHALTSLEIDVASRDILTNNISGDVLFPETLGFKEARTSVWNLDTAGVPAVIVKCQQAEDVAHAIKFATQNKLGISVHTAGAHSSHAVVDNCVVVDLSLLRSVVVNPANRTVTVSGGATIGDVDDACKAHGLVLPMGHVHHTGVAGMVMAGTSGVGFICRNYQLTASHLIAATVVTSAGEVLEVSQDRNSDLLWALRGAGANFGVAVEMVFSLEEVAPKLFAGDVVMFGKGTGPDPAAESNESREELASKFFDFFQTAPDQCSALLVLAPKGPVISRIVYCPKKDNTPEEEIERQAQMAFEPLLTYGKIIANETKMMDYWDGVQKMGVFAPSYYYQKGAGITDLPPSDLADMVRKLSSCADRCPVMNMGSGIIIMPLGGQLIDLDPESTTTAGMFQRMKYWIIAIAEFPDGPQNPEVRESSIRWVREVYDAIDPYSLKDSGRDRDYWTETIGDIYGENVSRLRELKSKYDPGNVFRHNRNILPQ